MDRSTLPKGGPKTKQVSARKSLLRYPLRTSAQKINSVTFINSENGAKASLKATNRRHGGSKLASTTSARVISSWGVSTEIKTGLIYGFWGGPAWNTSPTDASHLGSYNSTSSGGQSLNIEGTLPSDASESLIAEGTDVDGLTTPKTGSEVDGISATQVDAASKDPVGPTPRSEWPTVEELLNEELVGLSRLPDPEHNLKAYFALRDTNMDQPDLVPHRWKIVVDTVDGLLEFLNEANKVQVGVAQVFADEEGHKHGKDGVLCTIQFTFASMVGVTFILDVVALGMELFTTVGSGDLSLKSMLEDPKIFKCFHDVRNDSAALFHQYGIKLQGTVDLQITELSVRGSGTSHVWSLDKCIRWYLDLNPAEKKIWTDMKNDGQDYCNGDYSKWEKRPLPGVMLDYAANDTVLMPHLYARFYEALQNNPEAMHKVMVESARRVHESQEQDFVSCGAWAPSAFQ